MQILDADQVKISRQLRFMKRMGMVESERCAQWMVYRLAERRHPLLEDNLKCLQNARSEGACFRRDVVKRRRLLAQMQVDLPIAPLMCGR